MCVVRSSWEKSHVSFPIKNQNNYILNYSLKNYRTVDSIAQKTEFSKNFFIYTKET